MKKQGRVCAGIFSVSKEQWHRFIAMMIDSADNFSTWDEWKNQVDQIKKDMKKKGVKVIEVEVDLDNFSAWCDEKGREHDGASTAQYASELLRKQNT